MTISFWGQGDKQCQLDYWSAGAQMHLVDVHYAFAIAKGKKTKGRTIYYLSAYRMVNRIAEMHPSTWNWTANACYAPLLQYARVSLLHASLRAFRRVLLKVYHP